MTIGVVGRKVGMTRVFTDEGVSLPVTVIEIETNRISQVKTQEKDGYSAIQVTVGSASSKKLSKAQVGHYAAASVDAGRVSREFRVEDSSAHNVGDEVGLSLFEAGQKVDVTGTSKGKGFAGVVKRHNFRMQDATHGNSLSHRAPGSIGQNQTPGRVFKGKKMAGHMGDVQRTAQALELVRVDAERNLLLVKGAVPGSKGGDVVVRPSVKS